MSEFRFGDRSVNIAGRPTRLRLSLSALAEIASRLETRSPAELAARLRLAQPEDWSVILNAMAMPCPETDIPKAELLVLIPILSAVITEGLTP